MAFSSSLATPTVLSGGAITAAVNCNRRNVALVSSPSNVAGAGFLQCQTASPKLMIMPVRCSSAPQALTEELIKSKNEHNPVVVYSKTWCPYCTKVKGLFKKIGVKVVVVELNELVDETDVQAALKRLTGQSSVPNVFIGGQHIGGCDDTIKLHSQGKLIPMLEVARANMQG